ncbi:PolC-type DNA polymerase III N-terminal domain-containing protein, partial [Anaerostipes sp.]
MSTPSKPFFSVFPDLIVPDDFHSMFESVNIQEITLKKRENMLCIAFCCDHLISRIDTWRMERQIREQLFSKRFVKIRFHETYHLSEQYNLTYLMEHYMKSFLFELKGKGEVIFNV